MGLWPAWVKVGAATLAVLMVAGGAGGALAWRTGFAGRSNPGKAVQTSARPRPTPSQSPVVSTPTPEATPVASTLSCRLPISNGQPGSGGFVVFPSAKFQADPASSVKSDAVYGMSFDLAAGKWLPVPRSYISPDGTRYAYWDWQSRSIVAVSVASGAETQVGPRLNGAASAARLNAQNWQLIEALDDGVYATPAGETQTGLWLFPWSGSGSARSREQAFGMLSAEVLPGALCRRQCLKVPPP